MHNLDHFLPNELININRKIIDIRNSEFLPVSGCVTLRKLFNLSKP